MVYAQVNNDKMGGLEQAGLLRKLNKPGIIATLKNKNHFPLLDAASLAAPVSFFRIM
jgi:hypothetical protein